MSHCGNLCLREHTNIYLAIISCSALQLYGVVKSEGESCGYGLNVLEREQDVMCDITRCHLMSENMYVFILVRLVDIIIIHAVRTHTHELTYIV